MVCTTGPTPEKMVSNMRQTTNSSINLLQSRFTCYNIALCLSLMQIRPTGTISTRCAAAPSSRRLTLTRRRPCLKTFSPSTWPTMTRARRTWRLLTTGTQVLITDEGCNTRRLALIDVVIAALYAVYDGRRETNSFNSHLLDRLCFFFSSDEPSQELPGIPDALHKRWGFDESVHLCAGSLSLGQRHCSR